MIALMPKLNGQQASFEIKANERMRDAVIRIGQAESVMIAFPEELLSGIQCQEMAIGYRNVEELLAYLCDAYPIDYYKYDDHKFLIRGQSESRSSSILKGRIVDAGTGEALPLASVYYDDFSNGVFSDANGYFRIPKPLSDTQKILISFLGYKTIVLQPADIEKNPVLALDIEAQQLASPVISYIVPLVGFRGTALVSQSKDYDAASFASGLYGRDLLRYIQLMPGVAAFNDDNVELRIRGSNSEGSRVVIDGMPIYNVSHYYGIFSSVNNAYVESFELFRNTQPVTYEGMSGGLLLVDSESGKKQENIVDISLLTASGALDLPFGKGFKFQLAGRSSYRNVNDTRLLDINMRSRDNFELGQEENAIVSNQPDFRFYDVNAGLVYDGGKTSLEAHFFKSNDALTNSYDLEVNLPNQSFDRQLFVNDESWQTTAASIIHASRITDKLTINSLMYISDYDFDSELDSEIQLPMSMNTISNRNFNTLLDWGIKSFAVHSWGVNTLTYGTEFKQTEVTHRLDAEAGQVLINYADRVSYLNLFASYRFDLGKTTITLADRSPLYRGKDGVRFLLSPQFGLSHPLNEKASIKLAFSRTNQVLREIQYETRLGQNMSFFQLANKKDTPVLRTDNFMIGYNLDGSRWSLDVEAYSKLIKGNLLLSTRQPGFSTDNNAKPPRTGEYKLFKGDKRVYGADLTLGYRSSVYNGFMGYTLSWNQDRFPQVFRGEYFSGQDDRRHQWKLVNEWSIGSWKLNLNTVYASGKPYLALERIGSLPREELDRKESLSRLPDYFRMDIAVIYSFELLGSMASAGVSVYNLTNRQNVSYLQYAYKLESPSGNQAKDLILGTESELLNRSLNIDFSIRF